MTVYLKSYSGNKQIERQTRHFDVTGSVKWKIPFLSAREHFGNSNRNFWLNGSRPSIFPSRMLFLPIRMTAVTNIYLIGLFKSIRSKNACFTSLFSLFLTCTWSNFSQNESSVKTSIITVVFPTGYLDNERGDPPLFLPLRPMLVIT